MKIINAYYGSDLLTSIEFALANYKGDLLDVGVGYAKNLTGATFNRFSAALETWLEGGETRKFRLFIGDHRHPMDKAHVRLSKIKECTEVAANLIKSMHDVEEQIEVVFLQRLHAKFFSMWSHTEADDRLEWAIVGSSNLTDAALEEKNIELDVYWEPADPQLATMQKTLAAVIFQANSQGESWGPLHKKIDELTARSRWEYDKMKYCEESDAQIEVERLTEEIEEAEKQARPLCQYNLRHLPD